MKTKLPLYTDDLPYLTTEQMVEVDRAMIEDYGIELKMMMENAGRNLASLAKERFLDSDPIGTRVVVLVGTGGNGGGALVAARRLHNWGAMVRVFVTGPDDAFKPVPGQQLRILRQIGVPIANVFGLAQAGDADVVLDGIIGYSLEGPPRDGAAQMIRWANESPAPVLSLDTPSGIDTTTGTVYEPAIRAKATMTLALPKQGLRGPGVEGQVGELYLADIGVPPGLFAREPLALSVGPIFAHHDVVRLQ